MKRVICLAITTAIAATAAPPAQGQAAPYAVQVCWSNPACTVTTILVGGVYYYVVTVGGQSQRFPVEDAPPYLEDPEAPDGETWEEDISAASQGQAAALCRQRAQGYGAVFQGVRTVRSRRGNTVYLCQFRSYRG